jgi:radical SAM-linked protein
MSCIYRVKYEKNGPLKFISHLDFNSLFCRTLRRAKIDVELTQGFNPRFKISFGPALPLGIAGWQEVLDIYLLKDLDNEQIKAKINSFAPAGLKIKEVEPISEKENGLSKSLKWANYLIQLEFDGKMKRLNEDEYYSYLKKNINNFLNQKNILVEKNTKKGLREVDLRPYIEKMDILSCQDKTIIIRLIVDIQYKGSINPTLIINEFIKKFEEQKICVGEVIREQLIVKVS